MALFIEISAKVKGGKTPLRLKLAVVSAKYVTAGHPLANRVRGLLFVVAPLNVLYEALFTE